MKIYFQFFVFLVFVSSGLTEDEEDPAEKIKTALAKVKKKQLDLAKEVVQAQQALLEIQQELELQLAVLLEVDLKSLVKV
ncbi:unnamed protein product [Strongylus vulgaris]|uniref:Uncharacterized protein n=1 Tax=Strongylus vulgaris TaxID=40348 RepID=A0A3P7L6I4_STRVU|nr:unnamed protein product [Strongylus vulgaris]